MQFSTIARRLESLKRPAFQFSIVALLTSLGVWGHVTHWGSAHADASHSPSEHTAGAPSVGVLDSAGKADPDQGSKFDRIRLPSVELAGQMGIATVPAEHRELTHEVTASGVVMYEPSRRAQLSSRANGTVWRIEKHLGQEVRAGDVLAIIDSSAVGQAKADFLRSLADVELCRIMFDKLNSFGKGEVALKQIQEAETALKKARVDMFNAQQALISLGLPVKLEAWTGLNEAELQKRIKFMGLPESLVSQLDPDSTTASLLPIVAPFNAVVIGRDLTVGEVISPTENHFEIADVSRMWIELNVREQDSDLLEVGQQVVFTAGTATVTCSLSWIGTAVDAKTRTVEIRCETDNPEIKSAEGRPTGQRLLRANEFGMGKIKLRDNPSALTIPTRSLQQYRGSGVVFVEVQPAVFEARQVRSGIMTREYVEILEGLAASEAVVADGSHILKAELQRLATLEAP